MIVASDIELRAGARLLLEGASFKVGTGDRIGLVGRNGAGKTTLAKVLAARPLRPRARSGSPAPSATCRRIAHRQPGHPGHRPVLSAAARPAAGRSARGGSGDGQPRFSRRGGCHPPVRQARRAARRAGGYAAESQAASITASMGCPTGCCINRCTPCPEASGAGSSWPGSCSPIPRPCCSTSRPTTWTRTRWPGSAIISRPTAAPRRDQPRCGAAG